MKNKFLITAMSYTVFVDCSNLFKIGFLILFINSCTSAPVSVTQNAYTQFIAELKRNKCSIPSQVQLPFNTTKVDDFEYLSSHLEICQKTETANHSKEAIVLCKEIFDNIRNISCSTKTALPDINVNLSEQVCKDFSDLKNLAPEDDRSFLKRLTDSFLCEMMCDNEFEKACQVLLWSFEVQKVISSMSDAQEPEQPNVPEDGGNINVDDIKQDNEVDENQPLHMRVDLENEKKNVEEVKHMNEVEPKRISEVLESQKLEDNPEQKPLTKDISGKEGKKELVTSNKEVALGNKTVPNFENQDKTLSTKPLVDLKTSNSLSEQTTIEKTSTLTTKTKPMKEAKSGKLTVEINEVNELPRDSNTNVAVNEQAPNNSNSLSKSGVQNKKDSILSDGPLRDKFNVPDITVTDKTHQKDQNSDFVKNNELPDILEKERNSKGVANNEQNPLTLTQNKLSSVSNSEKSTKQLEATSTISQIIKETTQEQSEPETNSDSRKEETQDQIKPDGIADEPVNSLKDQKNPKVAQQIKELAKTIPEPTEIPISTDEKEPENNQNLKANANNLLNKSVVSSSMTETSTKTTAALEKMEGGNDLPRPVDEEADHFEDMENTEDEEYSRPEYDVGLYEVSKNKESNPNVPSPITLNKEPITNQDERPIEFPSRNSFGQDSSDIQMIAAFPEQEDSHFFFYFLSIVLILMTGYLIFHNKQKIIALIVEGRHERNRRSHRVGYKKLETK